MKRVRELATVACLPLMFGCGGAQQPAGLVKVFSQPRRAEQSASTDTRLLGSPELQAIVDGVATVPAEIGSDVLLRLAESNRVSKSIVKIRLLTRAFELA